MTPGEILREARRLIVEVGWCQGAYTRSAAGAKVNTRSSDAAAYCVQTAIAPLGYGVDAFEAKDLLVKVLGRDDISTWNDVPGRTREEVVAALDAAIALAEARA